MIEGRVSMASQLWLVGQPLQCPLTALASCHCARQQGAQLLQGKGIEHVLLFQPASPGLADAKLQIGKAMHAMGIGVYADQHLSVPKTQPKAQGELWLGRLGIQAKHDAMGDGEEGLIAGSSEPAPWQPLLAT